VPKLIDEAPLFRENILLFIINITTVNTKHNIPKLIVIVVILRCKDNQVSQRKIIPQRNTSVNIIFTIVAVVNHPILFFKLNIATFEKE
jgi:hypothetical protein